MCSLLHVYSMCSLLHVYSILDWVHENIVKNRVLRYTAEALTVIKNFKENFFNNWELSESDLPCQRSDYMFSTACVKFNVYIYTMVICVCSSHKTRGGQTLHAPIHKKYQF